MPDGRLHVLASAQADRRHEDAALVKPFIYAAQACLAITHQCLPEARGR